MAKNYSAANKFVRRIDQMFDSDFLDLIPKLTLFVILFTAGASPLAVCFFAVLTPFLLYSSRLHRSFILWAVMALSYAIFFSNTWFLVDNYVYLVFYWLVALALAFYSSDPKRLLQINARLLIGLVFLSAVLWKLFSQEYISGAFFHHALLFDERFEVIARLFCSADIKDLIYNRKLDWQFVTGLVEPKPVIFRDLLCTKWMVPFLQLWTISIELLIAVVHLIPIKLFSVRVRSLVLLLFCVTTYSLIPVIGFAAVLLLLGLAQWEEKSRGFRHAYLIILTLVSINSLIFSCLLITK